jgi:6-phosphogluconolactonase (cycloisomerase 2 family)
MHLTDNKIVYSALFLTSVLLSACGGGSSGSTATGTTAMGFAYVANSGDSTISQYTIDAFGALTPIGTVASGTTPYSVTIHPAGKFVYVANSGDQVISQYTISAGGGLVPMSPATVPSGSPGSAPVSIVVEPSGKYAYAANSLTDDISQFEINATTGALMPMTTATVTPCSPALICAQGKWPISIAVDSTSKFVYVVNNTDESFTQYAIGLADGALTPNSTTMLPGGSIPVSIAVAGDSTGGKYVYVANRGTATVSEYSVNPATGALLFIDSIVAGSNPQSPPTAVTVAGDSTGSKYVYVTNGNVVSQYTIDPGGTLSAMTTNPTIPAGLTSAQSIIVDPTGKYAYVANLNDNNVSQYTIGVGGALEALIPQATVATGSFPYSVAAFLK